MFKRRNSQSQAGRAIDTVIGASSRVQGDLEFCGGMHLDGRITGSVRADAASRSSLSVSEQGVIEGSVQVPEVLLNGIVRGDIEARERVVLGAKARVEGNVHYGIIEMALGAQISGRLIPSGAQGPSGASTAAAPASVAAAAPDPAPLDSRASAAL